MMVSKHNIVGALETDMKLIIRMVLHALKSVLYQSETAVLQALAEV